MSQFIAFGSRDYTMAIPKITADRTEAFIRVHCFRLNDCRGSIVDTDRMSYQTTLSRTTGSRFEDTVGCNHILLLHGRRDGQDNDLPRRCAEVGYSLFPLIRNSDDSRGQHTFMFSKWFAESGKMVKKLFDKLSAMAASASALVFVLTDKVESLAAARSSATSRSDVSVQSESPTPCSRRSIRSGDLHML
jgi:hypothetical protein